MADPYIHPNAQCDSTRIGADTRIWAFAYILEGAIIGSDANICSHVFIENDVVLGDRVTVKSGVQLWNGLRVEDDVFIGPNASFTNDRFPRSKDHSQEALQTRICRGASVGANATVLPGLTIGSNAMIGAGSVVTRSVPPNAIVVGNPGRITGYAEAVRPNQITSTPLPSAETVTTHSTSIPNVTLHRAVLRRDMRGSLIASEFDASFPFRPSRSFIVFDVPSAEIRGEHAHRACHQFISCVRGACSILLDDGDAREEFRLDDPSLGLYVPPMIWSSQFGHTSDALLHVLASDVYDADDYIRSYDEFLEDLRKSPGQ